MTVSTAIDVIAAAGSHLDAGRRSWLQPVGYGLLLGGSIALIEFGYYYPLLSTPDTLGLVWLPSLLLSWCGESVLLALTVVLFERWTAPKLLSGRQLVIAVATGSIAGVLVWQAFLHFVLHERFGIWLFREHLGQPLNLTGSVLYNVWLMLVFGGLGAAVYVSRARHGRMLEVLRAAELTRETSQRKLAEERLTALQTRIDPEFVLQTLTTLGQLYEADPSAADRLLEDLIAFLRAPPGQVRASDARTGARDALQAQPRTANGTMFITQPREEEA